MFNDWMKCGCRLVLVLSAACVGVLQAQTYPSRTVKLVVPYPAGGYTDLLGRTFATQLAPALGQQVIVENKPGAGSVIGQEYVISQPADGHTLMLVGASALSNPLLIKGLRYTLAKDFVPISNVVVQPVGLVISPSVPAKTVQEFVAFVKANPGKFGYATLGKGSNTHLTGEMFNSVAGIQMFDVPYQGDAPGRTALIRGDAKYFMTLIGSTMPFHRDGRVRILAVTGDKRIAMAPDIPTFAESGFAAFRYPGFAGPWFGMFVAKGTPPGIAAQLNAVVVKLLGQPEMVSYIEGQGGIPSPTTPEEFLQQMNVELPAWEKLIRQIGLSPD